MDILQKKIQNAFEKFIQKDAYLLKNNTSERSMTHCLAVYIKTYFPDYDVDCEFNRNGLDYRPKFLEIIKQQAGKSGRIYPDIIVHKRGKQIGIIAIETRKQDQKNQKDLKFDRLKLKGYKTELGYRHAFYITFPHYRNLKKINLQNYIEI